MGRLATSLESRLRGVNPKDDRRGGIFLVVVPLVVFTCSTYFLLFYLAEYVGLIVYTIASIVLLKLTFALKSMERHATSIVHAIERKDLEKARCLVSLIVSRDTSKLSEQQVISATVESVAESTVDGVGAPLFYFASLGVSGAVAYRVINTLDSMVGYKDRGYRHFGWFSAKLDTVSNFLPSRIIAILMVLSTLFLGEDWKNAWKIMIRDRNKTESLNAGYPMSTMAGALGVQLEKPGLYCLGDPRELLLTSHIFRSLRIMRTTVYLFILLVIIPLLFFFTALVG
jgi:adenosylcobinamide-phosphate synthase